MKNEEYSYIFPKILVSYENMFVGFSLKAEHLEAYSFIRKEALSKVFYNELCEVFITAFV